MTRCRDDDSLLQGQRFLGLWGFWKEERISRDHQPGAVVCKGSGSLGPSWGSWSTCTGAKGCTLEMKGGGCGERRKSRNQERLEREVEEEGGTLRAPRLAGRRLAVRSKLRGFQPTLTMDRTWQGSPNAFSSSRLETTRGPVQLGEGHSSTGWSGMCAETSMMGSGAKFRDSGQMAGPGARYQVVPEASVAVGWDSDSRAALPSEAGPEESRGVSA